MEEKGIFSGKGIEIIKTQDKRITVSQEGIEIRREGKPISFETPTTGLVYMVIDCSGSMIGNKLSQAKNGAINFAKDALEKGYLTGLIQFESSATHLCEPTKEISVLEKCIKNIRTGGNTNMAEAIQIANQKLQDKKGLRVIVIATDGMPDSQEAALAEAKQVKKKGIDIITIGTDDADRGFLKQLASRTDLGVKVAREQFGESITSAAKMLPQLGPVKKRR